MTTGFDLELDPDTGDLVIDEDVHLTTGIDSVVQDALINLRLFRGEWFLDLDEGVPYFERIDSGVTEAEALLGQKFDEGKARDAIRDALIATNGVVEIVFLNVSFDRSTRVLTVTWQVRTDRGTSDVVTTEV